MKTPDQNQTVQLAPACYPRPERATEPLNIIAAIAYSLLVLGTGCATSSHKVTGSLRAPVDADAVAVYHSMPAHARTIGIVSASSYHGITLTQADADVLDNLKQQAARMGANGIVVSNVDDQPLDGARGGAKAIFVSR